MRAWLVPQNKREGQPGRKKEFSKKAQEQVFVNRNHQAVAESAK